MRLVSTVKMPVISDRTCYDILKEELLKNKRVFKFQAAAMDEVIDRDHDIKNRINNSMPQWWERPVLENGFVTMKDFMITVSDSFNSKD